MKMRVTNSATCQHRPPTADGWKRSWQKCWNRVGLAGYALPIGGPGGDEREFLDTARTPRKERARLKRITDEFGRPFKAFYDMGPAVTAFALAPFKATYPCYKLARAVGGELAKAGFARLTGGGPGIVEAANCGARETGGKACESNIILAHKQAENPFLDRSLEFRYFFTRKVCLVNYSSAFIVMPGGLGTLDELFEAATLLQRRKIGPFPVILMGAKFWAGLREWNQFMMKVGVFAKDGIGFGYDTDSPKAAVDLIVRSLPQAVRTRRSAMVRSRARRGRRND